MPDVTRREFGQAMTFGAALVQAQRDSGALLSGSLTDVPGIKRRTLHRHPPPDRLHGDPVRFRGCRPASTTTVRPRAKSQVVMLQPVSPVERIHALFLTGGGVLALPAFGGVLRFLDERKVGFDWGTPDLRIPIVVSAVIDDLAVGNPRIRPDGRPPTPHAVRPRLLPLPKGTSAQAPARRSARCTAAAASAG